MTELSITTKQDAARLFGSASSMARALGISRQAVSQWPDVLTERRRHEIIGAAISLGLYPPRAHRRKKP